MEVLSFLSESPVFLLIMALLFGASIGSFLNVVIHRLPLMMYKEWATQCDEISKDPVMGRLPEGNLSLAAPGSFCPECDHPIPPFYNIPLLSYLLLSAKCKYCGTAISPRYFMVELICGLLCVFLLYQYGLTANTFFLVLFTYLLIPLIFIDIQYKLLPDNITYLLLWSGVIYALTGYGIELKASIIGIISGYISLWSVYILFKLATGKEGMGYGDFKLLAALGAWVGWQMLLPVVLISSIAGTLSVVAVMAMNGGKKVGMIPFGPFLAIGGWVTLIWGEQIIRYYFSFF